MSSSLTVEIEEQGDQVTYHLSGQIDEDANLEQMVDNTKSKIIFDLDQVKMINSCGIRDWGEFQNKIYDSIKIIYLRCPQVIVEQLNIIKGFIKEGGVVESFYAPYYNNKTDSEVKILLKVDEVEGTSAPVKFDEHGNELEFDEIELQYFNFLKNQI